MPAEMEDLGVIVEKCAREENPLLVAIPASLPIAQPTQNRMAISLALAALLHL
jgi:hypothetical protein